MINNQPRTLEGRKLITFNLATFGQILPVAIYNAYSFFYYVYVIGLDPFLTSMGIFLGLIVYGIGSPILGVLSDNKNPTKFGKRRPYLLYGLIPSALAIFLIWIPPIKCTLNNPMNYSTALYFWVLSIILNLGLVILYSPYMAMIPEQSETEKNRVDIAALQGILNILGTMIGVILPILLQSNLEDPQNCHWTTPSGQFLLKILPIIGAVFAILEIIFVLITFFNIDESFLIGRLVEKKTIKEIFRQMLQPLKHDNGLRYMGIVFGFNMAMRVLITIVLPFITYVLILQGNLFIWYIILVIPFAGVGFYGWQKKIGTTGLTKSFAQSLWIIILILCFAIIFFIPMNSILSFTFGVLIMGIALSCLVGGFIFPTPILSAIIDEAGNLYGNGRNINTSNLSGAYFGMNLFVVNIASAIANLILGVIFTHGNEKNPIMLIISFPIAALIFGIALISVRQIKFKNNILNKSEKKQ